MIRIIIAIIALTIANDIARAVEVENYRIPADGSDWGPAIQRARNAIASTGGVLRISTPGALTIATAVSLPKGGPYIVLRCDSQATVLTNAASLAYPMFSVGGTTAAGGVDVDVEGCAFRGANTNASFAFALNNANTMTFRRVSFSNMTTAVNMANSYAVTLDDVMFNGVTSGLYSSTSAHNFVANRVKAYGGSTTFRFDGVTDNISIVEGDYEGIHAVLQTVGGTALRFVGNYVEYQKYDPIYNTGPMYGVDISNNWIALGDNPWSMSNFVGGQFTGNSIYNQQISFGASTYDIEVGDNRLAGTANVAATPYRTSALTNGWAQQANFSPIGFRKGRDGRVHLSGNLINPNAALGTSAFTLPAGYRPASQRTFIAGNSSYTLTTVLINGDGQVIIATAAGAGTSGNPHQAGLDGIAFEPAR